MQHEQKNEAENTGGMQCPNCGQKVELDMKFCPRCGSSLRVEDASLKKKTVIKEQPYISGILEATSIGVFLMVLALTYLANPIDVSLIVNYIQRMADQKIFIKPPEPVLDSAIYFFKAIGIWGFLLSALRILLEKRL
ncbi:MAG: zinc ribbon domain-containing protein [Nitrososphaerota archaeon]|nr:zinc-ribbon domain-containing protein [Candidatus Bathyarchaeota archaeon]MDW8048893.1 zinc ribbon domain-containing protein [Nitrososphaerota archaeon]